MKRDAVFSEDMRYRYQLSRIWDETLPTLLFVMLNPSTADASIDDPTIRRVISFTKSWNYGGVYVSNLYAYRSTDPRCLKDASDPVGMDNKAHIAHMLTLVDKVVYAWGNNEKEPIWLRDLVETPYCIALSKTGIPKHPLYLKGDLQLMPYIANRIVKLM